MDILPNTPLLIQIVDHPDNGARFENPDCIFIASDVVDTVATLGASAVGLYACLVHLSNEFGQVATTVEVLSDTFGTTSVFITKKLNDLCAQPFLTVEIDERAQQRIEYERPKPLPFSGKIIAIDGRRIGDNAQKRLRFLQSQGWHCWYCGRFTTLDNCHLEHQIPKSRKRHVRNNLVASCAACNYSKGRKTVDEFRDYASPINGLFWGERGDR